MSYEFLVIGFAELVNTVQLLDYLRPIFTNSIQKKYSPFLLSYLIIFASEKFMVSI